MKVIGDLETVLKTNEELANSIIEGTTRGNISDSTAVIALVLVSIQATLFGIAKKLGVE